MSAAIQDLAAAACSRDKPIQDAPMTDLHEVSMNFDLDDLDCPNLRRS